MYDVLIVGAGASGLVSAIISARRGKRVLILEKNSKVGKKLLATGNGRCNITNQRPTPNRFHSKNPKFINQVLDGYNYFKIKEFFKSIGLELIEAKEGRVYPMSLQALSVVELLEYECRELGVEILCNIDVTKIIKRGRFYRVNSSIDAKKVVIATGNISAPQLGGVDDGLNFAKRFGHNIIKPYPSLVQLTSSMPNLKKIAGVKVESRVSLKSKKRVIEKKGDVLFTNYGISGLAILDISYIVVEELKYNRSVTLTIDLMPKLSTSQLTSLIKKSNRKKPINIWLQGFLNKKLISYIFNNNINSIENIVKSIKSFKFIIDGTRGYRGAEVASGGVDTREINPKTMESKIEKGLYFTGEVLDVDGDRGGFNLHFAWVCGMRVGDF
jgi:predicted Rossmann fold flavoprotein